MHLAPASEGLRNSLSTRYSPSKGPITKFSALVFQDGNSQLFLYQPSLPPSLLFSVLATPSQNCSLHNLPCWPQSTTFSLFLHSLPLSKSHQGSAELSLITTCQEMSLGSVPCLTPVVAIPHLSEMLHFWKDDFDWHHPAVFLFMSISSLRSVPASTTPVSTSGRMNVRREHFPFYWNNFFMGISEEDILLTHMTFTPDCSRSK